MSDSPLPQPPFTPHLILHTYPPWSLRGPRGSTFVLDKSWVTNHLSPAPTPSSSSLPGDLHGNPLCLAAQGSFLVSLPQLTLASQSLWIPRQPTTDLASAACLSVLQKVPVFSGGFPYHRQARRVCSTISQGWGGLGQGQILDVLLRASKP